MARFYDKGTHKVYFTEEEEAAQDELETAVAKERAANAYVNARQIAYPSIGDQLDQLFHDMSSDKGDKSGDWYEAVAKVKSDNPK